MLKISVYFPPMLIGVCVYVLIGFIIAVTVYVTHRNEKIENRPSIWLLLIINVLWFIFAIIWLVSYMKPRKKPKETYSIGDIAKELHDDERFMFERGVFHQVTHNCKYCRSEDNLDYIVVAVDDKDGREQFKIAFWECETCKESHMVN
ncbi:hypothetical protein ACQUY5_23685 [Bacillus cereus]|uniref:hypothetical protein n=1 Tax=Bacillus cereus TaxID=1396 RepID=UPI003D1756DF